MNTAQAIADLHVIEQQIQNRTFGCRNHLVLTADELKSLRQIEATCDLQGMCIRASDTLYMLWTALQNDQYPPDTQTIASSVFAMQEMLDLMGLADYAGGCASYYLHQHELTETRNENAVSRTSTDGAEERSKNGYQVGQPHEQV